MMHTRSQSPRFSWFPSNNAEWQQDDGKKYSRSRQTAQPKTATACLSQMAAKYSTAAAKATEKRTAEASRLFFQLLLPTRRLFRHQYERMSLSLYLSFFLVRSIFGLLSLLLEISNIFTSLFFFGRLVFASFVSVFFGVFVFFSVAFLISPFPSSFSFVIYSLFTAVDNPELCPVILSIPPTSSSPFSIFVKNSHSLFFYYFFLLTNMK